MQPKFTTPERKALVALCQQAEAHFQTEYNQVLSIHSNGSKNDVTIASAFQASINFDRRGFRKLLVETNAAGILGNNYLLQEFNNDTLELKWAGLYQILSPWSRTAKIDALLSGS